MVVLGAEGMKPLQLEERHQKTAHVVPWAGEKQQREAWYSFPCLDVTVAQGRSQSRRSMPRERGQRVIAQAQAQIGARPLCLSLPLTDQRAGT